MSIHQQFDEIVEQLQNGHVNLNTASYPLTNQNNQSIYDVGKTNNNHNPHPQNNNDSHILQNANINDLGFNNFFTDNNQARGTFEPLNDVNKYPKVTFDESKNENIPYSGTFDANINHGIGQDLENALNNQMMEGNLNNESLHNGGNLEHTNNTNSNSNGWFNTPGKKIFAGVGIAFLLAVVGVGCIYFYKKNKDKKEKEKILKSLEKKKIEESSSNNFQKKYNIEEEEIQKEPRQFEAALKRKEKIESARNKKILREQYGPDDFVIDSNNDNDVEKEPINREMFDNVYNDNNNMEPIRKQQGFNPYMNENNMHPPNPYPNNMYNPYFQPHFNMFPPPYYNSNNNYIRNDPNIPSNFHTQQMYSHYPPHSHQPPPYYPHNPQNRPYYNNLNNNINTPMNMGQSMEANNNNNDNNNDFPPSVSARFSNNYPPHHPPPSAYFPPESQDLSQHTRKDNLEKKTQSSIRKGNFKIKENKRINKKSGKKKLKMNLDPFGNFAVDLLDKLKEEMKKRCGKLKNKNKKK